MLPGFYINVAVLGFIRFVSAIRCRVMKERVSIKLCLPYSLYINISVFILQAPLYLLIAALRNEGAHSYVSVEFCVHVLASRLTLLYEALKAMYIL